MRATSLLYKARAVNASLVADYKHSLTCVAHPAVVLTTGDLNIEPRGITVSSFTSVSISPQPLIAFNLQVPSRTSDLMHSYGKFTANFLRPSEENAQLCRALAGQMGKDTNPFELFKSEFCQDTIENVTCVADALIRLYCTKHEVFKVQDHEIWTGKVYKVERVTGSTTPKESSTEPLTPMLYQKHQFHYLGDMVRSRNR